LGKLNTLQRLQQGISKWSRINAKKIFFKVLRRFQVFQPLILGSEFVFKTTVLPNFKKIGINAAFGLPYHHISGQEHITIGDNFSAGSGLYLATYPLYFNFQYNPSISIGHNVSLNEDCQITAINQITIGDNVLTGKRVFISDHSHGVNDGSDRDLPPIRRQLFSKGSVHIGHNVWIGTGAAIMPNVNIGHHSIVGANSVVTKSFPPYSVIAGAPARLIRKIPPTRRGTG
jgi:acetyltransferase-like isoleucine patch superfamily enzyme